MGIDAEAAREFAQLGVKVEETEPDDGSNAFQIWRVNGPSIQAFLACATQWRLVAGFSGAFWTGFDYAGVDVVLRRGGFPDSVFEDLRVMEDAALAAFGEVRN